MLLRVALGYVAGPPSAERMSGRFDTGLGVNVTPSFVAVSRDKAVDLPFNLHLTSLFLHLIDADNNQSYETAIELVANF